MKNKYKVFVAKSLYGLIEGSARSLQPSMIRNFERLFGQKPDSIEITQTNRFVEEEYHKGCWIGTMTVTLVMNGEEFSITRDWGEEYEYDRLHPDYKTDAWFYESDKCHSSKKIQKILKSFRKTIGDGYVKE